MNRAALAAAARGIITDSTATCSRFFFTYDSRNKFIFNREEESLCLNSIHLVGNFQIDRKKSERIIKDVNRIRD